MPSSTLERLGGGFPAMGGQGRWLPCARFPAPTLGCNRGGDDCQAGYLVRGRARLQPGRRRPSGSPAPVVGRAGCTMGPGVCAAGGRAWAAPTVWFAPDLDCGREIVMLDVWRPCGLVTASLRCYSSAYVALIVPLRLLVVSVLVVWR